MKYFRSQVCRLFVAFTLRKKPIFYVTGMRRSGNHAFVRWLTNALEGEKTELDLYPGRFTHFLYSESKRTLFFDEVNELSWRSYLSTLWHNRKMIGDSEFIIISTEDCGANYDDWRIPDFDYAIYVKRTILNVIASRLRKLKSGAEKGWVWAGFNIGKGFFEKLRSWSNTSCQFHTWDYEKWARSKNYRLEFLESINLEVDLKPSISIVGSSFSRDKRIPEKLEVLNRYKQIAFSNNTIDQLREYKDLLSDSELKYLEKEYDFNN